jgi:hypothetical protein
MSGRVVLLAGMLVLFSFSVNSRQLTTSHVSLEKILSNQVIWGKDFPAALLDVVALDKFGEKMVAVYPDKVQTVTTRGDVKITGEDKLHFEYVIESIPRETNDNLAALTKCGRTGFRIDCVKLREGSQEVVSSQVDGSVHVAATPKDKDARFLSPDATVDLVKKEFGPPEKITTKVIRDDYESRPIILTQYAYASGQITFITSNTNPTGKIEQVYLDAKAVSKCVAAAKRKSE